LRLKLYRNMAHIRHTTKAMEGDGSPSNHEDRPASPVVAEVAATSSSSSLLTVKFCQARVLVMHWFQL
jgi:hypothetical protein